MSEIGAEVLRELRSLRLEVRELRALLAEDVAHQAEDGFPELLQATFALLGNQPWTCDNLLEDARTGTDIESAKLRALLRQIADGDAKRLGIYLRGRNGRRACGLALHRLNTNRDKVRLWAVHPA